MSLVPALVKDRVARVTTSAHQRIFDLTRGRVLGSIAGMPVVRLTTTGRRSGKPRSVMLTSPTTLDGAYVLVASYGGDDRHPAWYHNLQADPHAEVVAEGRQLQVRVRTATPAERDQLWPEVTSSYRGYAGYQRKTDREIPLVVCDPIGA